MHLIQQHTFDIQSSSRDLGNEIQGQLGNLLEKEFYPKLDILLNQYAHSDHIWQIDLLEVQLPKITISNWKYEVIQKSLEQIEAYLRDNRPIVQSQYKDEVITTHHYISNEQHAVYLFFNFLKTGILIENTISGELDKIIEEIEVSAIFVKKLIDAFEADILCLVRWVFATPDSFKAEVMDFMGKFSADLRVFLQDFFTTEEKHSSEVKQIIQKFQGDKKLISQWIELVLWFNYLYQKGMSRDRIFKEVAAVSEQFWMLSTAEIRMVFRLIINRIKTENKIMNNEIEFFLQAFNTSIPSTEVQNIIQENAVFTTPSIATLPEFIYLGNAGLVLLHPFLKTLFERMEWCEDGVWNTKVYQHKAVLLTQYLVTGKEKMGENELVLNKILCGFPIQEVVNMKLKITKTEKEQALSLLQAVLKHWKIMSESSVEALQEIFLQREGKLELQANGTYELWVEEKGYDILLEQLPWGISMVKTPWMENYLTCNWN